MNGPVGTSSSVQSVRINSLSVQSVRIKFLETRPTSFAFRDSRFHFLKLDLKSDEFMFQQFALWIGRCP